MPSNRSTFAVHRSRAPAAVAGAHALLLLLGSPEPAARAAEPPEATGKARNVDFDHDVRPILADRCYPCHGPDGEQRQADLRFDARESVLAEREGGPVVVPGDPGASKLYRRITAESPRQRMPPARSRLALSSREIETLRLWIAQGAGWRKHWSFEALRPVAPPAVRRPAWARNPIDRFVLARLEEAGLEPAPPASRERLLRRVSLDLTGLPPTIAEIDAFLADGSPDAYERVVDRLLSSPAFGEHLAVDWLDVARFADTYGYQADRPSHLWPWRDWVIRAFNRDLPYDDFITWQLAGDLLPGASREQILATAFNRNHRQTNEGGSVNEEFRVEYNADRVKTTAMAFLGLTMECARCHDHKYDPISQREYYQLFAFFNSTDESGLYSHFTDAIPSPTLLLYESDEEEGRHRALKERVEELVAEIERRRAALGPAAEAWCRQGEGTLRVEGLAASYSFDEVGGEKAPEASGGPPATLSGGPESVAGHRGKALRFDGESSVEIPQVADFQRTDPFSIALWLQVPEGHEERERTVLLHHSKAGSDAGSRGYELLLEKGHASFALIHFWPGNALKVRTRERLAAGCWVHLAVAYDGSSRARGVRMYLDGEPAALDVVRDHLFKDITYGDPVPLQIGARFRGPGFQGGTVDELRIFRRALTALEAAMVFRGETSRPLAELCAEAAAGGGGAGALEARLAEYYLDVVSSELRDLRGRLRKLREEENALAGRVREIMVMGDLSEPRPTHVLHRGRYDAPGERVAPGTPARIFPGGDERPPNRLGLARWLTDPRHPLTARVTVNRYWQLVFGRGIVATAEDFGTQGERPTHPELLDWLAGWFIARGWDLKALVRLLVTSATYRQSSLADPEKIARDPENLLLSRGPRRRLSAEAIRDVALATAGVLDRRLGGPSVPGDLPPGFQRSEKAPRADRSLLYRRSVYIHLKRTDPPPYLITFDATSRETCIARRLETSTPLQALVLLNDALFTEAALRIAERLVREGGEEVRGRIALGFRLLTGRRPLVPELEILCRLFAEERELFQADPSSLRSFLEGGIHERDRELLERHPEDLAALAVVATALLNFDETIHTR